MGWTDLGWKCLGVSLLYVGGMFLNDAWDAGWDREHRPERPVPSGRISRGTVWLGAVLLLAAGLGALGVVEGRLMGLGAGLLGLIFVYTACHKRTAWAVVPMGGCRMLAYWIGGKMGVAVLPSGAAMAAGVVGAAYILGLTLVARGESQAGKPVSPLGERILVLFLVPVALSLSISLVWGGSVVLGVLWACLFLGWGGVIYSGVAGGRLSTGGVVGRLLAGIPLLDGAMAGSFVGWGGGVFVACFVLARASQRRVAAT